MSNFDNQLKRMQDLMKYNSLNESSNDNGRNIEYFTIGADNKVYGIIRENNKFYIKTTNKGSENITESYDYIGGFCNKKDYEYSSYTNAIKQLEMKLMSINESLGKHTNVNILDPDKKEFLAIEGTEKMKGEIARQREIMANASKILKEDSQIGQKNVGVPEAPKTASFSGSIGEPYTDKAEAKLDKDLTDKANDPKSQGTPFDQKCDCPEKINSDSMKTACKDSCDSDYEDAKYVPDNSVANKKVKGNFTPKMNESCDEWGSCGLPSDNNAGVSKDKPDVMGESSDDIVGQDDSMDDSDEMYNDDVMSDDDFDRLLNDSGIEINDSDNSEYSDDNSEYSDDDIDQSDYEDNSQDYEDYEDYEDNGDYEGNDDYDDELEYSDDSSNDQTFESRKRDLINSIVESVTSKILRKRGNGIGILLPNWFNDKAHYLAPFYNNYSKLVDALRNIKMSEDANEVDNIYRNTERVYLKLKKVIKGLQNGLKLNMHDDEYSKLKQIIDSTSPEDINTLLMSIDDVWEQVCNAWDDKYAKEADKDFNINNNRWNYHKVNDLGYDSYDPDDLDAVQRRDSDYEMEGLDRNIKEDKTVLHDFGKHPGYRKKPMTLPSNSDDIKDGYKDWNDDSVKGEKPFGLKIGSSAPFDEKVKMITDAIMDQLKENFSKKKS